MTLTKEKQDTGYPKDISTKQESFTDVVNDFDNEHLQKLPEPDRSNLKQMMLEILEKKLDWLVVKELIEKKKYENHFMYVNTFFLTKLLWEDMVEDGIIKHVEN